MTGSVLFYVQHLLGIGHLRRAHYLINGMTRQGLAVTLVSGGEPLPELKPVARGCRATPPDPRGRLQLQNLVGADGRLVDDALWAARRETLLAA